MTISAATDSDIQELTEIEIASKIASIPSIIEEHEVNFQLRSTRWKSYFHAQSPQTSMPERLVLKAVIDGKIIGYIAGHLSTRYNLSAEIQSFYILKEYQRKGIGNDLFKAFIEWLIKMNATSLCVGIAPNNHYKAFYVKNGGEFLNEHWIYWPDIGNLASKYFPNT